MSKSSFTIATFNANGIRARLHIILPWMERNPVDCLCIQETKVQDKDFPTAPFSDRGLNVIFSGQKAYNGVAVVSPHQMKPLFYGFPDSSEEEDMARQICCSVKDITVINSYVPQGRSLDSPAFEKKLHWFSRISGLIDRDLKGMDKLVWCGDMNVAPEPIDVYAPELKGNHVCFHESVRKAFKEVLKKDMEDCFRMIHPGESDQYSFFDYRIPKSVERKIGWRIDHIVAQKNLSSSISDSFIDIEPRMTKKPSDHTFVVARFEF